MTQDQKKKQIVEWVVTGIAMLVGLYNHLALIKNWPHIEIVDEVTTKYVNWFYDLIVGAIAFWRNNNITSFAQLCQILLNKLKEGLISPAQVEEFIDNPTVQMVAEKVQDKNFNPELIDVLLTNSELQEIAQYELDGKEINVKVEA